MVKLTKEKPKKQAEAVQKQADDGADTEATRVLA